MCQPELTGEAINYSAKVAKRLRGDDTPGEIGQLARGRDTACANESRRRIARILKP
jgi:hypothetical protein